VEGLSEAPTKPFWTDRTRLLKASPRVKPVSPPRKLLSLLCRYQSSTLCCESCVELLSSENPCIRLFQGAAIDKRLRAHLKPEVSFIVGKGDSTRIQIKLLPLDIRISMSKIHLGSCEWENVKRHPRCRFGARLT
jgi:hypothetical protein